MEVTILIGVSFEGRPIAGVINQPYFEETVGYRYRDAVVFGIDGIGYSFFT